MKINIDENNVVIEIGYTADAGGITPAGDVPDDLDVLKYKYINGSFAPNPDYTPYEPTESENVPTQDDYNMDFDYRLSCLELGL